MTSLDAVACHNDQYLQLFFIYSKVSAKNTNILSCDYRYQKSDLVKLDILLNGQPVDAMAAIVHNLKAQRVGRELVDKLKKFIDRYGTGLHLGTIWLWCLLVIHALIP